MGVCTHTGLVVSENISFHVNLFYLLTMLHACPVFLKNKKGVYLNVSLQTLRFDPMKVLFFYLIVLPSCTFFCGTSWSTGTC